MTCLCGDHETQRLHFLKEFRVISRLIILNKIRYYCPEKGDKKTPIHDEQYDSFEQRYLQLCKILNKSNKLVHKEYSDTPEHLNGTGMLEVDFSLLQVQKVIKKLQSAKSGKKSKKIHLSK